MAVAQGEEEVSDEPGPILDYSNADTDIERHRRGGRWRTGVAFVLIVAGYLLLLLLSAGDWLLYGYDTAKICVFLGAPVAFLVSFAFALSAFVFPDADREWSVVAMVASAATLGLWVLWQLSHLSLPH